MKPFLIVIVVLVLLALLAWVLMRGAARKRDEQRAEAASIRAAAAGQAADLQGHDEFTRQFQEREAVARAEADAARARADEQARIAAEHDRIAQDREQEAAEVGSERAAHEELVADQRSAYEAELSRADEIDPDVKTPDKVGVQADEAAEIGRSGAVGAARAASAANAADSPVDADAAAAVGAAGVAGAGAGAAKYVSRHSHGELDDAPRDADVPEEADAPRGVDAAEEADAPEEARIVADTESYASTEPFALEDQAPAVEPEADEMHEDTWDEDPVGEPSEVAATQADHADVDHAAASESAPADAQDQEGSPWGRRVAGVGEIRDGGYGVGSAAPFPDGAMPQDHPVQAYHDTMTYRTEDSPGYDSAEPDVWFYDAAAAERAGFQPSQED
jgi:hypothetical protein